MEFYFLRVEEAWVGNAMLEETISKSKLTRTILRNQGIHRSKPQTDIKLR